MNQEPAVEAQDEFPYEQLLAYYRAVHQGIDPDSPRNLSAVVEF